MNEKEKCRLANCESKGKDKIAKHTLILNKKDKNDKVIEIPSCEDCTLETEYVINTETNEEIFVIMNGSPNQNRR